MMKNLRFRGLMLAAGLVAMLSTAQAADICSQIGGKPGIYLKDKDGIAKKITGDMRFPYRQNMWLWIIPDRPAQDLEVTWHVLVQSRKSGEAAFNNITVRRNKVKTACQQEYGNDPSAEFGTKISENDHSATFSYPDHNDYVGDNRKKEAPNNGSIRDWHFNWKQAKNKCPYTADYVEKAKGIDGEDIAIGPNFRRSAAVAVAQGAKTNLFTTVSSVLVHRPDVDSFCYNIPLRAPYGPEGETRIKRKKLPTGGSETVTITWTK